MEISELLIQWALQDVERKKNNEEQCRKAKERKLAYEKRKWEHLQELLASCPRDYFPIRERNTMSDIQTRIVMVGPTGVGKTSLLTAMYGAIRPFANDLKATFFCSGGTAKALQNKKNELVAISSGKGLKISNDMLPPGTGELREYDFTIETPGDLEIDLRFIDQPGGWFSEGNATTIKSMQIAHASIWCVDAVALMEGDGGEHGLGDYHEMINEPDTIYNCYEKVIKDLPNEHCIVLVAFRAETYLKDKVKKEKFFHRLRTGYADRIKRLTKLTDKHISFKVCAVETLGNVVFHVWEEEEGHRPKATFRRTGKNGYLPSGCALPIAIALKQGIGRVIEDLEINRERREEFLNTGGFTGVWRWITGASKQTRYELEMFLGKIRKAGEFLNALERKVEAEENR